MLRIKMHSSVTSEQILFFSKSEKYISRYCFAFIRCPWPLTVLDLTDTGIAVSYVFSVISVLSVVALEPSYPSPTIAIIDLKKDL